MMNDLLLVNLISLLKKSRFVTFELNGLENADEELQNLTDNFEEYGLTDIKHQRECTEIITVGILPEPRPEYRYREDYL